MKLSSIFAGAAIVALACFHTQAVEKIDFNTKVKPILEGYCVSCHNPEKAKENGDLDLSTMTGAADTITAGQPEKSSMFKRTILSADDKKLMPPTNKGGPLQKNQIEIIKQWIADGANWPEGVTLKTAVRIEFVRDVQPLLEKGGPFDDKDLAVLRSWIEQGTVWPEGVKLGGGLTPREKEMALVNDIQKKILAHSKEKSERDMKRITEKLAQNVSFEAIPIRGGQFVMGSAERDKGRQPDEGPQHKVKVDPFWMGKCEVTWDEYELFMYPDQNKSVVMKDAGDGSSADATAHPTKPYVEMSFGMGKNGFPAISMTQHAANKYCQWLSAKTGHFYRLPTEAEWEYACRAGTKTVYSFGDKTNKISDYAWSETNSEEKYQKVGTKKPNQWGLHDMHGNVSEWCLDGYDPKFYMQGKNGVSNPWNKGTNAYPHVVRGGSWQDGFEKLRSSVRNASSKDWKQQDPQLPKSIWYLTDAQFLGFRVVCPLKVPSAEEMFHYWNNGVETE